jgi:hypothetical protein
VANEKIHPLFENYVRKTENVYLSTDSDGKTNIVVEKAHYCVKCFSTAEFCPTGHHTWQGLPKLPVPIVHEFNDNIVTINRICATCANPDIWQLGSSKDEIDKLSTKFSVVTNAEDRFIFAYEHNMLSNLHHLTIQSKSENPESIIDNSF